MTNPMQQGGLLATTKGKLDKAISGIDVPVLSSFLNEQKEYVFESRSATAVSEQQEASALTTSRGGKEPTYSNNNLYGFVILQFKQGFGGGWRLPTSNGMFGFDVSEALTGGDSASNVTNYFFTVNPRAVHVGEPFTSHIVPTQGNGYYSESQGIVLRPLNISGTTGFRPSLSYNDVDSNGNAPHRVGEPTGYLNHMKLRNVFRNYSDLKKKAGQAYKTFLVWYNGEEQEAWFCEPESFDTTRDASSPLTRKYDIRAVLLQKMSFSSLVSRLTPGNFGTDFWLDAVRRAKYALQVDKTLNPISSDLGFNSWVNTISETVNLIDDLDAQVTSFMRGGAALVTVPFMAVSSVATSAMSVLRSGKTALASIRNALGVPIDGQIPRYHLGLWRGVEQSCRDVIRYCGNMAKTLMKEAPTAKDILDVRSTIFEPGTAGKIYNTIGNYSVQVTTIPYGATSLKDVILEKTGSLDLIELTLALNGITKTAIGQTPSLLGKTGGDTLLIPVAYKAFSKNIETVIFPNNMKGSIHTELLGRDLRLLKHVGANGITRFELALTPSGDLDIVGGRDNMIQAIEIKLNTERDELPLHPGFGMISLVGEKVTINSVFNAYLALNDTLQSDGRIDNVTNMKVVHNADTLNVSAKAHVVGGTQDVPVSLSTMR